MEPLPALSAVAPALRSTQMCSCWRLVALLVALLSVSGGPLAVPSPLALLPGGLFLSPAKNASFSFTFASRFFS